MVLFTFHLEGRVFPLRHTHQLQRCRRCVQRILSVTSCRPRSSRKRSSKGEYRPGDASQRHHHWRTGFQPALPYHAMPAKQNKMQRSLLDTQSCQSGVVFLTRLSPVVEFLLLTAIEQHGNYSKGIFWTQNFKPIRRLLPRDVETSIRCQWNPSSERHLPLLKVRQGVH